MADAQEYIVNTGQGKLQGTREDRLFLFKGIPFAAPPVGKLRWMPPQHLPPWKGTRSALEYGIDRKIMIISEECHVEKAVYEEERKVWEKAGPVDLNKML